MTVSYTHLLADFTGVPAAQLTDRALVGGLVVAAASAAGLGGTMAAPVVRALPSGGITAALLLDGSHIAVHTRPDDGVLLLDVLAPVAPPPAGVQRAADVFARRLSAVHVHTEQHARG